MKTKPFSICILFILFPVLLQAAGTHSVYNLRCEHEEEPLGIETPQPRFSWQIHAIFRTISRCSGYS